MSEFQLDAAVLYYSVLRALLEAGMLFSAVLLILALYKLYVLRSK